MTGALALYPAELEALRKQWEPVSPGIVDRAIAAGNLAEMKVTDND
jgi:hypothetical protein